MDQRFYFACSQVGAEKAVKAEVAAALPFLRFAFSRPGFVTFKEEPVERAPCVLKTGIFTRLWGEVLGQIKDRSRLPELLSQIPKGAIVHRFDRDLFLPGQEHDSFERNGNINGILRGLLEAAPSNSPLAAPNTPPHSAPNGAPIKRPRPGDTVYDLIWVDDFHLFLGRHTQGPFALPLPGNIPDLTQPEGVPSRAYLKIEEAFARCNPAMEKGLAVLELGCVPGGATVAMLGRGLRVTGVDPQFMDDGILARPGFAFIRKPARFLTAEDLRPCNPDWLVMDMSVAPSEALPELAHAVKVLRSIHGKNLKLRHGFLTLKLNRWELAAEIPDYLNRLVKIGFRALHPMQLFANRQEFFVWAGGFE